MKPEKEWEHTFSIEMESKDSLKHIKLSEGTQDNVLIEGSLGALQEVVLHEDALLEVKGTSGTLRLDMNRQTLESCLKKETGDIQ
jgi:hypothetical protein